MSATKYLDNALQALRSLGISVQSEPAPVLAVLEGSARYDQARVMSIATTLQQASAFNAAVRDQIKGMEISTRYADITDQFNSIRDDTQQMASWMEDGKLDMAERIQLGWMRMRRGSVPDRFEEIRVAYLEVASSANSQIEREGAILRGYEDFRLALKEAEIDAQEVLKIAQSQLELRRKALAEISASLEQASPEDGAARSRIELSRDEAIRALREEDKSYQVVKDIADELKTAYSASELVFARLNQTHVVKERLYQRMVSFFATNEVVFTGLSASFTSMAGLSEATNTMDAMKDGINQGLEALARTGGQALERGLEAGYGATLSASSVKILADSIVEFQADSLRMVEELRTAATQSALEIERTTEDSKKRFAAILTRGA